MLVRLVHSFYFLCFQSRLQNNPHFCVFKYARAVKQKVWNEAENRERDWGVRLARFAHIRLLRHALPISLLILRKKPTVLQSTSKAKKTIVDFRSFQGEKSVNTSHWTNLFRPFFLRSLSWRA